MRKGIFIAIGSILIIALVITGIEVHQAKQFNRNITINHIKVGGLTSNQAMEKLKKAKLKNEVYIGQKQILNEKDTTMGISKKDLPQIDKILKEQRTFFPSSKTKDYTLQTKNGAQLQSQKKSLEDKLKLMNKNLTAPKDAQAHWDHGKIIISKSQKGKQYDITKLLKLYGEQKYNSEIHLEPAYILPIEANSPIVKKEKEMLQKLMKQTVQYKLQEHDYAFKASELITEATVSRDLKYHINPAGIKQKLSDLNEEKSTLHKNYTFKTHSGKVITVKGESYGWAIDIDGEAKRIEKAFAKGQKSIKAYNIYGIGYSTYGIGYHVTTNHGIGNTYAEVSIQDQKIWIYKDGQLKVTTHVVTGRHDTHEDTPTGVWYIMYKESPSILEGSEVGNPHYSIKVQYWAPFTNSGCGFHDASWRTNWSNKAYLTQGSGGCVNTPPSVMKKVYDNLSQNEPVIIY